MAKTKYIFIERNTIFLKIITYDPSIYITVHRGLTVSNFMGNSIGTKRVNPSIFITEEQLPDQIQCYTCKNENDNAACNGSFKTCNFNQQVT